MNPFTIRRSGVVCVPLSAKRGSTGGMISLAGRDEASDVCGDPGGLSMNSIPRGFPFVATLSGEASGAAVKVGGDGELGRRGEIRVG